MNQPKKRSSWVVFALVLLPMWLLGSGVAALWYYFHLEKKQALEVQERFAQAVSAPLLADDLRKLVEVIGERNGASETAAANLSRAASMIEGLLGPTNTGYAIEQHKAYSKWPILRAMLTGSDPNAPAIWVVSSYDSRPGSRGAEGNATGLAATVAAAQALAADQPVGTIHFVFLPHANDPNGPLAETAATFSELVKSVGSPKAVLYVEAMGDGESLWVSSLETNATPLNQVTGLGDVRSATDIHDANATDFATILSKANLPAVRVSTRRHLTTDEPDDRLPFAPTVAASTGRLIELIRRCAAP